MKRYSLALTLSVLSIALRAHAAEQSVALDADVIAKLEAEFSGTELEAAKRFMAATDQERVDWRRTIRDTHPGEGCYTVEFPSKNWQKIDCGEEPKVPHNVGGSYGEQALSSSLPYLDNVTGHFANISPSGLTTSCESDSSKGSNYFTVQLNTNFFYYPGVCPGSSNPSCEGWQQFIYEANGSSNQGSGYIQYWMINYAATSCPSGWSNVSGSCYKNSGNVHIASHTITILDSDHTYVEGWAPDTTHEGVMVTLAGTAYSHVAGSNFYLLYNQAWQDAEFNVYGWGNSSAANFSCSVDLYPTIYTDGAAGSSYCLYGSGSAGYSYTAETNNLTNSGVPWCTQDLTSPSIWYNEYH